MLLDQLLKEEKLRFVGCCNELNAGYAGQRPSRSSVPDFWACPSQHRGLVWVTLCSGHVAKHIQHPCILADGYARARGVGVVVTTFTVGGLSAINAVAGAYSENLPVICITGARLSPVHALDVLGAAPERMKLQ